jgi:hypothetical protein
MLSSFGKRPSEEYSEEHDEAIKAEIRSKTE